MTITTKIMKINIAFVADTKLHGDLCSYEHINPVKSKDFLECFKHIVSTCGQFDGRDMLLVRVKLGLKESKKKQLINQADVTIDAAPDPDFDAHYPSCDVDGGDTSNFSIFRSHLASTTQQQRRQQKPRNLHLLLDPGKYKFQLLKSSFLLLDVYIFAIMIMLSMRLMMTMSMQIIMLSKRLMMMMPMRMIMLSKRLMMMIVLMKMSLRTILVIPV